jgi:Lipoprotein LpqB beta-propeller domain/Sporulation and spore germination
MSRLTTLARALVVAVVAAAVAGCVSIPDSSPVREGREVDARGEPGVINNIPVGPTPGATPMDIVSGYFAAMLAYPQTDEVARQFLTPTAAENWSSDARVVVYDSQAIAEGAGGVDVHGRTLGWLDSRGAWTTTQGAQAQRSTHLRLTKIDGEWRIINPLPGLYVDREYFLRSYAQLSLYYFDPTRTALTPDPVYLLIGDDTATELIANLLLGPTRDLVGVAESIAPLGTELVGDVRVTPGGLATIPLSQDVLALDELDRQLLAAQLTWTLRQLPDVDDIAITVDGAPFEIAGVGARIGIDELGGYDPAGLAVNRQLYALSSRGMVTLEDSGVVPQPAPIQEATAGARSVAVDPLASSVAVVSTDGTRLTVTSLNPAPDEAPEPRVWLEGATDLLRPSWDVHGVLWAVDRGPQGAVVRAITGPNSDPVVLEMAGLSGRDIQGFAVSRDGVRFAAVVAEGDQAKLVIAKIQRPANQPGQVSLRGLREVVNPDITLTGISGLAWASPTGVALLANGEAGDRQIYQVSIDGSAVEGMTGFLPSRPVSLAAGPNADAPLAIGARNGKVYVQNLDLQWTEVPSSSRLWAPTYPG